MVVRARAAVVGLLAVALLALIAAGCGGAGEGSRETTPPVAADGAASASTSPAEEPAPADPSLRDLRSVEELGVLFDEAAGQPRLVLLLSPT